MYIFHSEHLHYWSTRLTVTKHRSSFAEIHVLNFVFHSTFKSKPQTPILKISLYMAFHINQLDMLMDEDGTNDKQKAQKAQRVLFSNIKQFIHSSNSAPLKCQKNSSQC